MMRLSLPDNSVDLWYTRIDHANAAELLEQYRSWMTVDESRRGDRFIFDHVRQQYVITRGLIRWVLSRYCDVQPDQWRFAAESHGKPYVLEPHDEPHVFNLSHTRGIVICGVTSGGNLGVDVERLDREKSFGELARRYFAPGEVDWFERSSPHHRNEAFFRIWTLKEAYIKAVGKGLAIPLDSFEVIPPDRGQPSLRMTESDTTDDRLRFGQLQIDNEFQIAIAAETGAQPLRIVLREVVPGVRVGKSTEVRFEDEDRGPVHRV